MKSFIRVFIKVCLIISSVNCLANEEVFSESAVNLFNIIYNECPSETNEAMKKAQVVSSITHDVNYVYPGLSEVYNVITSRKNTESGDMLAVANMKITRKYIADQLPPYDRPGTWTKAVCIVNFIN